MKNLYAALALALSTTTVAAETVTVHLEDRFKTVKQSVPYTQQECVTVDVPVYGTVQRQGDAAGSALLGMIIGGAAGKAISGNNDGAAAGAVIGGIIGADKGARVRDQQVVTGYRQERQCTNVTRYRNEKQTVYDYTIGTFQLDGKVRQFTFIK